MDEARGGCLCGRVRYEVAGPLADAAWCHCRLCQRAVGAPAVPWVTVVSPVISGDVTWFRSSPKAERGHCAVCGTSLFFRAVAAPERVDITLASLDAPEAIAPTYQIHIGSKLPWVDALPTLPAHTDGGPDWAP